MNERISADISNANHKLNASRIVFKMTVQIPFCREVKIAKNEMSRQAKSNAKHQKDLQMCDNKKEIFFCEIDSNVNTFCRIF